MTEEPKIVYIQPEASCEVCDGNVRIVDVACVYCKDEEKKRQIEQLVFMHIDIDSKKKYVVSSMALIACIDRETGAQVVIQNVGEKEFVISAAAKTQTKTAIWGKAALVTLITFFGSIFAIMTYNEDVDVTGVFDKLYGIVMGRARTSPGLLEAAYAVGVGAGVIIFFNHFGKQKLTKEPTPMEIEMEKYEADITETLIKEASRKGEVIDGEKYKRSKDWPEEKT